MVSLIGQLLSPGMTMSSLSSLSDSIVHFSHSSLAFAGQMGYALWHDKWTSKYLAGQDPKDHDVHAARL